MFVRCADINVTGGAPAGGKADKAIQIPGPDYNSNPQSGDKPPQNSNTYLGIGPQGLATWSTGNAASNPAPLKNEVLAIKAPEPPKPAEALKPADPTKQADSPKQADAPKPTDEPKTVDPPKQAEPAKNPEKAVQLPVATTEAAPAVPTDLPVLVNTIAPASLPAVTLPRCKAKKLQRRSHAA